MICDLLLFIFCRILSRYTLDVTAAISFALDIQAQTKDDNPFVVHAKALFDITLKDMGMVLQS